MRGEGDREAIPDESVQWVSFRRASGGRSARYSRLSVSESRIRRVDKVAVVYWLAVAQVLSLARAVSYLRRASTTMKMTRSNGAAGGGPYSELPYTARPGSNGL